jgi:hypothetical protein
MIHRISMSEYVTLANVKARLKKARKPGDFNVRVSDEPYVLLAVFHVQKIKYCSQHIMQVHSWNQQ